MIHFFSQYMWDVAATVKLLSTDKLYISHLIVMQFHNMLEQMSFLFHPNIENTQQCFS